MSQGSFRGRRRKSPLSFGGDIEPPIATKQNQGLKCLRLQGGIASIQIWFDDLDPELNLSEIV
jgi:hypothetical protein